MHQLLSLVIVALLTCLSVTVLVFPTAIVARQQMFAKSFAVVIGISKYAHSDIWTDLPYATRDAKGMASVLADQGFDVKQFYDESASRDNIISWLEDNVAARLTGRDRILFFFSGHGETRTFGGEDHGYVVPYAGGRQPSTWISMEALRELSTKMGAAQHQLFIFDSCFGGLFAAKSSLSSIDPDVPDYVERIASQKARQYLTAGGRGETVRGDGPRGYSYFTGYLLEALEKGKADTYTDGFITASELAAYLGPAASNEHHTPRGGTLAGHEQGDFLFYSPLPSTSSRRATDIGKEGIRKSAFAQKRHEGEGHEEYGISEPVKVARVQIRNGAASPSTVRPGTNVQIETDYSLLMPTGTAGQWTDVQESFSLKKDGKVLTTSQPKTFHRVAGGWKATKSLPIPQNAEPGTYVVETKVQVGSSYDTDEAVFVVEP